MEKEPTKDTRPDWIKNNETGSGEIEYNGTKIPYTVLKKTVEPKLPGFLGYPNKEHLVISEEVPEEFIPPQLFHELVEFTELNGEKGRCLNALKSEFSLVPEDKWPEYMEYRRTFFARLVKYYENSTDEEFKAEIKAGHEFLQKLGPDLESTAIFLYSKYAGNVNGVIGVTPAPDHSIEILFNSQTAADSTDIPESCAGHPLRKIIIEGGFEACSGEVREKIEKVFNS